MKTLQGIRVIDVSQNLAGPQCTQILGDLGADVIKVEPLSGDPARAWGPPFWEGEAPLFLSGNRNKRSIALDLKSGGGRQVLERLIESADIFVQSFRKGVIESLGFGHEKLRARRPELIYASITGFGAEGPLSETPGYDPLIQAYSGIMSLTGHPDGPPARVGGAVVDIGTGMWTALGILAALRERDQTGRGTHVESSLLATALVWISYHLTGYLAGGELPLRAGSGFSMVAPYEAFPTQDGELMILAGNDGIFVRLCEALAIPEVAADPRFATNPDRVSHRQALTAILASHTRKQTTADLRALLEKHRVPCSPIQDVSQVVRDPQVAAAGILDPVPHPRIPNYREVAFPIRFDGERPQPSRPAPQPGEHTSEILTELNYTPAQIQTLVDERCVSPDRALLQQLPKLTMKILILCTGNSCRSQMAEGLLRSLDPRLDVQSAGTHPSTQVNPNAIRVMQEIGVDISKGSPKNVDAFLNQPIDYVITVCGDAEQNCPVFGGRVGKRLHIGFPDPANAAGTEQQILQVFRECRDNIKTRFTELYEKELRSKLNAKT